MLPSFTAERYINLVYHNWLKNFFIKTLEEPEIVEVEVGLGVGEDEG